MCIKTIAEIIEEDRNHHIRITEDYIAGFSDVPDYECDDFKIEKGVIKVFATGDRPLEIDGATCAPDKIGDLDIAPGYILHDLIYAHLEDISAKWGWSIYKVRKWADSLLQNAIAQQPQKGSGIISYIYYYAVRIFGWIAHSLGKIFVICFILFFSGCAEKVFDIEEEPSYEVEIDEE